MKKAGGDCPAPPRKEERKRVGEGGMVRSWRKGLAIPFDTFSHKQHRTEKKGAILF